MSRSPADTARRLALDEVASSAASLRKLARRLLRDQELARDAVQDSWLAAVEHPPDAEAPVLPWLRQVLRNVVRMAGRRRRFRARHAEALAAAASPLETPAADQLLERHEGRRLLVDELGRLPEPYRSTILLRYFEGLSAARIARLQGLPPGTVRWRLKYGLDLLRRRLTERAGDRAWAIAIVPVTRLPSAACPLTPFLLGAAMTTKAKLAGIALCALVLLGLIVAGLRWPRPSPARPDRPNSTEPGALAARVHALPAPGAAGPPKLLAPALPKQPGDVESAAIDVPPWAVVAGMPARAIRGRVLAAGKPLPGAQISILSGMMPFRQGFERTTRSDANGSFGFPPQAASNWIVTAAANGLRPEIVYVDLREPVPAGVPVPAKLIEIEMQPCAAWARGVVRDEQGHGIAGADVRAALTGGLGGHSTRTSATGRYEICVPRLQGNAPPVIHARADGYGTFELAVPYSESTAFDFVLVPQATLSGRVTRQGDGTAVAGAKVSAFPIDAPGSGQPAATVARRTGGEVLSDATGEFHLEGLAPGRFEIRAEHDHHSSRAFDHQLDLPPGGHAKDFVVLLSETSIVEGTLLRAGKPVPWTPLHFSRKDPRTGNWLRAGSTQTLADGTFQARLARATLTHFFAYPRREPRVTALAPQAYAVERPVQRGLIVELPDSLTPLEGRGN